MTTTTTTATSGAPAPSSGLIRRAIAGGVLVVLGLLLWAVYRVAAGSEAHAYTPGEQQSSVTLEAGHKYWIGVPGGRAHLRRESSGPLQCRLVARGGGSRELHLALETAGTKATDDVASFIADVGGSGRLACDGVFDAYVDNATGDPSGWALVAATALLTVGAPLLLSVGYSRWQSRLAPGRSGGPVTTRR